MTTKPLIPMSDAMDAHRAFIAKFNDWMAKVDAYLVKKCGLESADLIDIAYMDLFEDGYAPAQAANKALKNEGYNG